MSIKYYQLAKDEALPDEFCAVRDVNGEPSEYMFYVPEAENAKMRELVEDMLSCIEIRAAFGRPPTDEMYETFAQRARELGVEVDG